MPQAGRWDGRAGCGDLPASGQSVPQNPLGCTPNVLEDLHPQRESGAKRKGGECR